MRRLGLITVKLFRSSWLGIMVSVVAVGWSHTAMSQSSHEHAPNYDQYTLQASAEGDVENDLMLVRLKVEYEDQEAVVLASKVNTDMQWALDQVTDLPSIKAKTESYTTRPIYKERNIVGWRSAQTISLSGQNFDELKAVLQVLQGKLQVQSMAFQPTDATRKSAEDQLVNQALDNFKHRAAIIQKNMGASGYRIIQININTGGRQAGRISTKTMNLARSASVVASPAVESGESKISVSVSGQIQLQ